MPFKKTLYPFIFAAIGLIVIMSACQNAASQTPTTVKGSATLTPTLLTLETETPTPTATVTQAPVKVDNAQLKDVNIVLQHSLSGDGRKTLEELVDSFNQSNQWGIRASAQQAGDAQVLYSQLESGLVQGDYENLPNLILAAPQDIAGLNDQDAIMTNLAPFIADSRYGLSSEERSAIGEKDWARERGLQGYQISMPALRNLHLLFYNQTWAHELGYSQTPDTTEDFRKQACDAARAITAGGNADLNGTGGWIVSTDAETMISWMYAYGDFELPVRLTQPYQFNTPSNQKLIIYFNGMFINDCMWISRQATPYDYFAHRQALMYSGDVTDIPTQTKMNGHANSSDVWSVLPYPGNGGKKPLVVSSGLSYAVLRHGEVPDLAAWLLARWLNQPENQAKLSQASALLPASASAGSYLSDFEARYPQWKDARGWLADAIPAPAIGSWYAARTVLSDAGWQIFHPKPTPDSPSLLLDQINDTLNDVLLHKP